MAIKRIYDAKLNKDGLDVTVEEVIEDKKRGLVASLNRPNTSIDDKTINNSLGNFIRPWQW